MEKFEKKDMLDLAKSLMFTFTENELEQLQVEAPLFLESLSLLDKIDTTGVLEMSYPFEAPQTYLRLDVEGETLEQEAIFENAPHHGEGYFKTIQVVKK